MNSIDHKTLTQVARRSDLINPLKSAATLIAAGIFAMGFTTSAIADETPNPIQEKQVTQNASKNSDPQQQINTVHNVKVATIILTRPSVHDIADWDESELRNINAHAHSCSYAARDKSHIDSIISILKSENIKADPQYGGAMDASAGAFLTLNSGVELRFVFERAFPNKPVRGLLNDESITANNSVLEDLYRWAAKMKVNKKCESFIGPYRAK